MVLVVTFSRNILAEKCAKFGESSLELTTDATVDQEVWWEIEDNEEVSHGLQTHHPQGGDVVALLLDAVHLDVCKSQGLKHNSSLCWLAILVCWSWPTLKSQFGKTCVINVRWNGFHTTSDFDLTDTTHHLETVDGFIFLFSHYQQQSDYKLIGNIFLPHFYSVSLQERIQYFVFLSS